MRQNPQPSPGRCDSDGVGKPKVCGALRICVRSLKEGDVIKRDCVLNVTNVPKSKIWELTIDINGIKSCAINKKSTAIQTDSYFYMLSIMEVSF